MAIWKFADRTPVIGKDSFVAETADVIGKVVIGSGVYIGPGAVVRGDYGEVHIGDGSAIEENCTIHARPGEAAIIGKNATIGHAAILHTCTIHDNAVIGMGAIVSDYAEIGVWSVVGEGAVVKNRTVIPDAKIAVGVPAKVIADVTDEYKKQWQFFKAKYVELARRNPKELVRVG